MGTIVSGLTRYGNLNKILLMICLTAYILTAGGHFSSTDEEDLFHNTALLSSQYATLIGLGSEGSMPTPQASRAPQEIGQSLVALPWYWLGQALASTVHIRWWAFLIRAVMTTFNMAVTLATLWVLMRWVSQLASYRIALVVAGLYGLTSLAWPYSQTFYREPLVGLCLVISFWSASRFRTSLSRTALLLSIAAMMLAISTKVVTIMAMPWWLACCVPKQVLTRSRIWQGVGIVGLMMIMVTLFTLPAKAETLIHYWQEFRFDLQQNTPIFFNYGLQGLLTSPGKGLLITSPTILLAFIGFPKFWQTYRREAIAIGGLFLTFLLVYSTRRGWHGGACWGPRYLLPVLPLMMLPALEVVKRWRPGVQKVSSRMWLARGSMVCLALFGFLTQVAAVSIFPLNYYLIKAQAGVISPQSLNGGSQYLQEIFFTPKHSPVWGQAALAVERSRHLFRYGDQEQLGVFPAEAGALLWDYLIGLETLDFWWLYLGRQSPSEIPPNSYLGVVLAPPEPDWLNLARGGGAAFNRWQINWRDVEPVPGEFDFQKTDRELQAIKAAGLETTVILTYPPDWATQSGSRVPLGLDLPIDSEKNEWAGFVQAVVQRYPDIHYWEIWNEPDLDLYWDGTSEDYFKLLRTSYLVIKETNPEAQVIMGGLAYWVDNTFFERVLAEIRADPQAEQHNFYFDISAWHWYVRADDLYEKVIWARAVMARYQIDKPIWVNETNIALHNDAPPQPIINSHEYTASPKEQAAFIIQAYANARAAAVEKMFVFRLDDALMAETWGLVTNEQIPRPAYVALQAVTEFLGDATPLERHSQDGMTRITFRRPDGEIVWVIWNELPVGQRIDLSIDREFVRLGYPDRRLHVQEINDGQLDLVLLPATVKYGHGNTDYAFGGPPIFVFIEPRSEITMDTSGGKQDDSQFME